MSDWTHADEAVVARVRELEAQLADALQREQEKDAAIAVRAKMFEGSEAILAEARETILRYQEVMEKATRIASDLRASLAEKDETIRQRLSEVEAERDEALVGEAYANGMGLAAVEAWESRALKAEADQERMREALERVNTRYYLADDDRDLVNAALSSTPTQEEP